MIYSEYGSTGVEVSAIGLGGMRFENPDNPEECAALVKAAYDAGISYFDTAPGYCGDRSEEIYGLAIKEMKKTRNEKPFSIATKSNQMLAGDVRKNLETSLERLGVDSIDFYHVWYVLDMDNWRNRKKSALKAFEKAKEEGLAKHICISSHMSGDDIGGVLAEYPFDGVLLGYSAMNFAYREAALEAAARLGRGVVVMNPLGGGLIPQHPERFDFVRTREDESVVEGALRFLINDPRISVALAGCSNQEQLREVIKAVDGFEKIPVEKIESVRAGLKDSFDQLCTACRYCEVCPEGIPVSKYMDAHSQFLLSGKKEGLTGRLKWHWGIQAENHHLDACTECGACEKVCTQKLPIIERLKEVKEILAAEESG